MYMLGGEARENPCCACSPVDLELGNYTQLTQVSPIYPQEAGNG